MLILQCFDLLLSNVVRLFSVWVVRWRLEMDFVDCNPYCITIKIMIIIIIIIIIVTIIIIMIIIIFIFRLPSSPWLVWLL